MTDKPEYRPYLLALAAYTVATLVMTYPLALNFTTHVPGSGGDDSLVLWALWWVKHSIVDLGVNPLYTEHIFYPNRIGLAFHSLNLLNGFISIPLQFFLDLATTDNILTMLSFVLSGFGVFLLAEQETGERRAAFVGGLLFAFCTYRFAHLPGGRNLTSTQWLPFFALFMLKALREERTRLKYVALAGVLLGFNFLTEYYFFIIALLIMASYLLFRFFERNGRKLEAIKRSAVIVLFSLPFVAPVMAFIFIDISSGDIKNVPASLSPETYSADLMGFLMPNTANPVIGNLLSIEGLHINAETTVFIGFIAVFLAVLGALKPRRENPYIKFWISIAAIFFVLSLGPSLQIMGKNLGIPLPFRLIQNVPMLENMRAPGRLHIATMLAISVLASAGLAQVLKKRRYVWMLLVPVILLEHAALPINLIDSSVSPVYYEIAKDEDAQSVLEVPFFVRDGFNELGASMPRVLYYQTIHGKKILNGYICRCPDRTYYSYLFFPVLRSLIAVGSKIYINTWEQLEDDRNIAGDVRDLFGIDYIVLHKIPSYQTHKRLIEYFFGPLKIYEDDSVIAYNTSRNRPDEKNIDAGTGRSVPYLYRGWINGQKDGEISYAWSRGPESVLLLNLNGKNKYEMLLRLRPHERLGNSETTIYVNGVMHQSLALKEGWKTYRIVVPSGMTKEGVNRIAFRFPHSVKPKKKFDTGNILAELPSYDFVDPHTYYYYKVTVLDWEHDSSKFNVVWNYRVSVAFDWIKVKRK